MEHGPRNPGGDEGPPKLRNTPHWAINTTTRCQNRCVYCFEGDRAGKRDVPPDETRALLRDAAARTGDVIFMGAEPTLNPDILALIRYASELGLRAHVSTNGLRFARREFLAACLDAGLSTIELSFSYPDAGVYAAVTGTRPEGFRRLLTALENIEECNASRGGLSPVPVNVNLVVSGYNVDRLDVALDHVRSRFRRTPFTLTVKRILPWGADTRSYRERCHVPLGRLRPAFEALARAALPGIRLMFRGFPLCALPGMEHLDADLERFLSDIDIRCNFQHQDTMGQMYSVERMRREHPYSDACDTCRLRYLCLDRRLFVDGPVEDLNRPVPLDSLPPGPLLACPGAVQILEDEALRRRAGLGDPPFTSLRRALQASCPPGAVQEGHGGSWAPFGENMIRVRARGEERLLRLGLPDDRWGTFAVERGLAAG
ncbi:MAG: radical SAM protein, partial [Deltaproteobacteria bacterium]|nr:radical SAM protein [Deltaproteobacteria bacterium]